MKIETLKQVDRKQARELWQKYREHRAYHTPADAEIAAIYKRIAQGKTVIRALESIRAAGLNEEGLPKLAIAPANFTECWLRISNDSCRFGERHPRHNSRRTIVRLDWQGLRAPQGNKWQWCAVVPIVPVHLRPNRGLQNYHVLWEAEWTKRYPVDPYLLRRFGGDAWLVVAAWELTDVERAVMSSRLTS